MATPLIPLRPQGYVSDLKPEQQLALSWFVLSKCTRKEAFVRFARPDLALSSSAPALDNHVKEFFASKSAKEYIEAYTKTIENFLHPAPVAESKAKGSMEERKARAKTKLVEFAMSLADNIENAGDPEFVLKIADKAGLLDMEEKVEEQPRRYIPQSCLDGCRYRMFVEENCEDECQFCRYKKYSEENGVHFENEEMLDIPQKVAE